MLRKLLNRIRLRPQGKKIEMHRGSQRSGSATGTMLLALLPACPVCEKSMRGHFFIQVASTIANDNYKSELTHLITTVRQHDWIQLTQFKEWNALADNLVVYVVKGDHQHGSILVVKDVFELYAPNDLILVETISEADIVHITNQLPGEWQKVTSDVEKEKGPA